MSYFKKKTLIFNLGELKLCNLAELCFFTWLWRNQTSKNQLRLRFKWHIKWRNCHYVTEKHHQNNVTKFSVLGPPAQSKFRVKQCAQVYWS